MLLATNLAGFNHAAELRQAFDHDLHCSLCSVQLRKLPKVSSNQLAQGLLARSLPQHKVQRGKQSLPARLGKHLGN